MLKRLICMMAACTLLCACMSVGVAAAERNMFKNGNFTKNMNSWSTWSNDPANCTVEYVKDGGVDGSGAMCIVNNTPMANSAFQYANLKYGKT